MPLGTPEQLQQLMEDGIKIVESIQSSKTIQEKGGAGVSLHPDSSGGKKDEEFDQDQDSKPKDAENGRPPNRPRGEGIEDPVCEIPYKADMRDNRRDEPTPHCSKFGERRGDNISRDAQNYGRSGFPSGGGGYVGSFDGIGDSRANVLGAEEPGESYTSIEDGVSTSKAVTDIFVTPKGEVYEYGAASVTKVAEATRDDVMKALMEPPSKSATRLRGISGIEETTFLYNHAGEVVKRGGHRREYWIESNDGEAYMFSWCNPLCAPVRSNPRKEKCICNECPEFCARCARDCEYRRSRAQRSSAGPTRPDFGESGGNPGKTETAV